MPRRSKKYGSFVFYNDKGELYARVQIRKLDGRYKTIKRRAKNLTHVAQLADEIKREYEERGEAYIDGRNMTMAELAEWYKSEFVIEAVYSNGKKVEGMRTWKAERQKIDRIMVELGHVLVNHLDESHLRSFRRLRLKTVSITTVNRDLEVVRAMIRKAVRKKWRKDFLDFGGIIENSLESRRTVTITTDEEARILEAARGFAYSPRLYALILTLRDAGARPNELYPVSDYGSDYSGKSGFYEPIRWRDIFDDEGGIRDVTVFVSYKGKQREERIGIITERMKVAFLDLWEFLQNSKNTTAQHGADLDNLVFPHKRFSSAWAKVRVAAGVPHLRLRDLRRDWVTRLARAGFSDKLAQRGAGHKTFQMSYHYTEFDLAAAMQAKAVIDADNAIDAGDAVN